MLKENTYDNKGKLLYFQEKTRIISCKFNMINMHFGRIG